MQKVNEHQDNLVLNAGHSSELNALAGGMLLQQDLHLVKVDEHTEPAPFAVITSRNLLERIININTTNTAPDEEQIQTEKERHTIANTVLGILAEEAGQRNLVFSLS